MSTRFARCLAVCAAVLAASTARAQGNVSHRLVGVVFDSLARQPLAGARIELAPIVGGNIGTARAAISDLEGRFDFPDVAFGRYAIVFRHAALDTLGLENREQVISFDASTGLVRLATPSPVTVMRALCPSLASADSTDSTAFLAGHLYGGPNGAAVAGAAISVTWQVPRVEGGRLSWQEETMTAHTNASGWFGICALPGNSALHVQAGYAADSTGLLDLRVQPRTIRHVSLYLSSHAADSRGQILGRVRDAQQRPLARVNVVLSGRERVAMTDSAGAFKLDSVPDGTLSLEFRAIGFAPVDTIVRLTYERSVNVDVELTRATVLAPVVSTASGAARSLAIFEMHRKSSMGGYFVQPARVEGYASMQRLHTLIQGLPRTPSRMADLRPVIFIDGARTDMSLAEVDEAIDPDDIVGVEFYTRKIPNDYLVSPRERPVLAIWTRSGPRWSSAGRP